MGRFRQQVKMWRKWDFLDLWPVQFNCIVNVQCQLNAGYYTGSYAGSYTGNDSFRDSPVTLVSNSSVVGG